MGIGPDSLQFRRSSVQYKSLGTTDIKVSEFALGCWPFAGGSVWGPQDDNVSIATVHAALDKGITFFDTAEGYDDDSHSEEVLGRALVGRRGEAVIATKIGAPHLVPDLAEQTCEASLQKLQTDYIDLYQIHWPNHDVVVEDSIAALLKLRDAGKIRSIGVCNFGVQDLTAALESAEIVTDQLPYNLLWRPIEVEIQPTCLENNVGLICYSPLRAFSQVATPPLMKSRTVFLVLDCSVKAVRWRITVRTVVRPKRSTRLHRLSRLQLS